MLSLTCLISSQHLLQVSSTRYGRRSSREDCVASKCPCLNYNQWLQICGPSVRATLPGKEQWMSSIGLFCRVLLCPPIRQPPFASQAVTKSLDTVDILDLKLFAHDWAILWVPEHIHQLLQDPLPIQFRSREVPYIQRALRGQQKSCKGFCTKQQRMYLLPGTQWWLKRGLLVWLPRHPSLRFWKWVEWRYCGKWMTVWIEIEKIAQLRLQEWGFEYGMSYSYFRQGRTWHVPLQRSAYTPSSICFWVCLECYKVHS